MHADITFRPAPDRPCSIADSAPLFTIFLCCCPAPQRAMMPPCEARSSVFPQAEGAFELALIYPSFLPASLPLVTRAAQSHLTAIILSSPSSPRGAPSASWSSETTSQG